MASARENLLSFDQFEVNGKPLPKLKVDELKHELASRGLEKTGLKKDLQERLFQALVQEKNSAENSGLLDEKPVQENDEISSQEVSSTTGSKDVPSMIDDKSKKQEEQKDQVENNEQNNDEKKPHETEKIENKKNESEEVEDGEILGQEKEKKDVQESPVPEKRKRISLTRQKSNNPPTPGTRKRKWSSSKSKASVVISTDSLKELIPGVQLASTPALEAVMELDDDKEDEEEVKEEKQGEDKEQENEKNANNRQDEKSSYKRRIVQVADSKTVKLGEAENETELEKVQNDIEIIQPSNDKPPDTGSIDDNQSSATPPLSETPTPVKREITPPRNPPSCSIHVSHLVRPFTQKQLVQYLSQFGAVTEEGFWINKIKSHCYVTFPSIEEATNARESMHGQRWPATSPRTLRVDFADNDKMLEDTEGALGKKNEESVEQKKENIREEKERSRSKERSTRKHKEKKEEKKKDEPSAANLLDKLFRKTTTMPCIYWLPLTKEQIVIKEKEREERRKQRQIALEQEKKEAEQKPREITRKPDDREKPRETERPKPREMSREQDRRPVRGNRGSSPPARARPDRRPSPGKRRSRSRSPAFRRKPDRRR